jgi:hypothetical protein
MKRRYLVIGLHADLQRRFAKWYDAADPQGAEDAAIAENPGLRVCCVMNEEFQILE